MTALLVMAYGSPATLDDVEAYYTHIRRGRRPSPEQLAELVERYRAIGGRSPLIEITRRQAEALGARLGARLGEALRVYVGMKHSPPFIADAVAQVLADGVRRLVTVTMAPQYSAMSVGEYHAAVAEALRERGASLPVLHVDGWHRAPGFVAAVARRLRAALDGLPADARAAAVVVFTAHSLPARIAEQGDPYPQQFRETAEAVAAAAGVERWRLAYQSAGRTPEPWLGPDVNDVIRELAGEGARAVVACPVGFVADHLEVLYDLDVEAARTAAACGLAFARSESLNDAPDFIEALADFAWGRLAAAGWA